MSNDSLVYSIRELTELLEKHYEKKVIVLIDEYDVPLAKANENGTTMRWYYRSVIYLKWIKDKQEPEICNFNRMSPYRKKVFYRLYENQLEIIFVQSQQKTFIMLLLGILI